MKRPAVLALFAILLLSSCDDKNSPERLNTRIEEADSKAQSALDKIDDLESKISDLETKVEELEANQ